MRTTLVVVALVLAGCGGGDDGGDAPATTEQDSGSPAQDTGAPADDTGAPAEDMGTPAEDTATPAPDTGAPAPDTGTPPQDTGPAPGPTQPPIPASSDALFAYLKAGSYKSFVHESAPHASTGPHGTVQVYINDKLDKSLAAGNPQHPEGAGAVKELWSGSSLFGWAVMVKTAPESSGGNNWYWFELFNTTDPSSALEGKGIAGCTDCHSAGRDFYRSPYPL